jgi:hypothetical protein
MILFGRLYKRMIRGSGVIARKEALSEREDLTTAQVRPRSKRGALRDLSDRRTFLFARGGDHGV